MSLLESVIRVGTMPTSKSLQRSEEMAPHAIEVLDQTPNSQKAAMFALR